jgi:hypothetical protein
MLMHAPRPLPFVFGNNLHGHSCTGDFARLTFFRGSVAAASDFIVFASPSSGRHSSSRCTILAFGEVRHA